MRETVAILKVFASIMLLVIVGVVIHSINKDRKSDVQTDPEVVKLLDMHTKTEGRIVGILENQATRISELGDRVRCLEEKHNNKPIVPGILPAPKPVIPE